MTRQELQAFASSAETQANDFRAGQAVSPQRAAELWTAMGRLGASCAALVDRIEAQENRRVGRPPKDRHRVGATR